MPPATLSPEVREIEQLAIRADFVPGSWDDTENSVGVRWSAGADVLRFDWRTEQQYWERLDFAPGACDMSRLNSGACPVLDNHNSWGGIASVIGRVKESSGTTDEAGRTGDARIIWTKAADAQSRIDRVRDGTVRSVSFGYERRSIERTQELKDGSPIWIVRKWAVKEISPVCMPADEGAGFRSADNRNSQRNPTNPCTFTQRGADPMAEQTNTNTATISDVERKQIEDAALTREATRTKEIRRIAKRAKLGDEVIERMCTERKTLDEVRAEILELRATEDEKLETRGGGVPANGGNNVEVGETEKEKVREAVMQSFMLRADQRGEDLAKYIDWRKKAGSNVVAMPEARSFAAMRMLRLAEMVLRREGVRTDTMSDQAIAKRAFASTSDLPNILSNVQGKSLRMAYEQAGNTFESFVRRVPVNDFKPVKRMQLSGLGKLKLIPEGGKIENGKISDTAQGYQVFKYGEGFPYTWEMMINDDLDALSRLPLFYGQSLAQLEGDLVWNCFTSNSGGGQVMDETSATLFHVTTHLNVIGGSGAGVLNEANVGSLRTLIALQRAPNLIELNLDATLLIVPRTLEIAARKIIATVTPNQSSTVNPLSTMLNSVIAEARLDRVSTAVWFMAASKNAPIDLIELASIAGESDLMVDTVYDFDTKGIKTNAMTTRAAAVIDYRAFGKSTGV